MKKNNVTEQDIEGLAEANASVAGLEAGEQVTLEDRFIRTHSSLRCRWCKRFG